MRGAQWTPEEEHRLQEAFLLENKGIDALTSMFGRTDAAIVTRLVRMNLLVYVPLTRSYHKVVQVPWLAAKDIRYPEVVRTRGHTATG